MKFSKPVDKLQLIDREIDVSGSRVLFNQPITPENLTTLFELPNSEWSDLLNSCGNGCIGSICGWWTKRVGIERSPNGYFFTSGRECLVRLVRCS